MLRQNDLISSCSSPPVGTHRCTTPSLWCSEWRWSCLYRWHSCSQHRRVSALIDMVQLAHSCYRPSPTVWPRYALMSAEFSLWGCLSLQSVFSEDVCNSVIRETHFVLSLQ